VSWVALFGLDVLPHEQAGAKCAKAPLRFMLQGNIGMLVVVYVE